MSSYPSTVKAVGIKEVGGVDKIEDLELPFPSPKPNELLVKARWLPLLRSSVDCATHMVCV